MRVLAATAVASLVCYWLALENGAPRVSPTPIAAVRANVANALSSFGDVAAPIKRATVSIRTVQYLDPPQSKPTAKPRRWIEGIGSGVIVDGRGYILTNEHVVRGADRIEITIADPTQRQFLAKLVRADPGLDLALLRIESPRKLPAAALGDSSLVQVGDWAIAIGSPFGLSQTVTVGVISAVRQSFRVEQHVYSDFFQTDAAINRGNSGGPLVNSKGEIIGINTAIYGPTGVFSGIGFAIPSNQARAMVAALKPPAPPADGK
ncbi:MAG: trypsin-like peptidase domain-containing protein [Elusimicrobia bacterium]|nr:trypsin-like peptidase domain-containing protein [Elusimicrobiota bacterium]